MRNLCALLLVLAIQTSANAQRLPPVPQPPPPDLPTCATALIAVADDVYYYETVSCTSGTAGYGQSSQECVQYGCSLPTPHPDSMCNCTVQPLAPSKPIATPRNWLGLSDCMSLPAEPEEALAKIKTECDAVLTYLKKLLTAGKMSIPRRAIVQRWAAYIEYELIPYLNAEGGAEYSAEAKIAEYCGKNAEMISVPDAYRKSEFAWRSVYIDTGLEETRRTVLLDMPQKFLRPESETKVEGKNGYTVTSTGIQRVTVGDVAGHGTKTVYFATFRISKTFSNGTSRYTYTGLQVEAPADPPSSDTATLTDRSSFAHVIKVLDANGCETAYAVTTVDDLSI